MKGERPYPVWWVFLLIALFCGAGVVWGPKEQRHVGVGLVVLFVLATVMCWMKPARPDDFVEWPD